jgi:hypothetical protein
MKNLLINYLSGDKIFETIDLEIYFKSLSKITNADKFVLTNNVSDANLKKLESIYDKVIFGEAPFYYVYHLFYDILKQYGHDYEYVMYIDTRDVIIQKNPFDYMISKPEKDLFLICEGMKVSENEFNLAWHKILSSTQIFPNADGVNNLITNGGTIGGKVKDYMFILLLAMTNANRKAPGMITDQSVYTSLYPYLKDLHTVDYCHPYTSTLCATGEGIKYKNIDIQFINGEACNMQGEPYYLFHQWDRTEYAEEIRNKQKNTLSFSI